MLIDEFKKAKMYALKEKNEDAKAIYSVLINKCMLALIDKREKGVEITDADYVQIVNKTLKELSDEKEAYAKAGNEAKVASISAQEEICKKYLPTMMSEEEIRNEISKLEDNSIPSVMKHFKMNFAGKVDMGLVNKIAKSL